MPYLIANLVFIYSLNMEFTARIETYRACSFANNFETIEMFIEAQPSIALNWMLRILSNCCVDAKRMV